MRRRRNTRQRTGYGDASRSGVLLHPALVRSSFLRKKPALKSYRGRAEAGHRNGVLVGWQRGGPLGFAEKLGVSVLERGPSPDTSKEGSPGALLCSRESGRGGSNRGGPRKKASELGPSADMRPGSDDPKGHRWIHSESHFPNHIKSPLPSLMIPKLHCLLSNRI